MNLNVKKDKRSTGKFFHKSTGFKSTKTKKLACIDISKEVGKNYIVIESIVLKACSCEMKIFNINTNLL